MFDDAYCHILSDELTENLHERGEQCLDGRGDRSGSVLLDTQDDAIPLNAAAVVPEHFLQRRMIFLRARKRPSEQGVTSVLAHGIAQGSAYA